MARVSIVQEPEWAPVGWSGLVRKTENLLAPPKFETQNVAWQVSLLTSITCPIIKICYKMSIVYSGL